jgi:electron transfer flavoprotein alpha subunit
MHRPARLSTLAVLEQKDGKLNIGSLSAVSAAQKLGGSIHGFVAGSKISEVAAEASKVAGIEKVISVDNSAYDRVSIAANLSTVEVERLMLMPQNLRVSRKILLPCWSRTSGMEDIPM